MKDTDRGFKALAQRVHRLAVAQPGVSVGVLSDAGSAPHGDDGTTVLDVAIWNEFGTARIPARSFIRETVDLHQAALLKLMARLGKGVIKGVMPQAQMTGLLGEHVVGLMKERIAARGEPKGFAPNAPSTIKAKGADVPLIAHTGQLRNAITYRTEGA